MKLLEIKKVDGDSKAYTDVIVVLSGDGVKFVDMFDGEVVDSEAVLLAIVRGFVRIEMEEEKEMMKWSLFEKVVEAVNMRTFKIVPCDI